MSQPALPLPEDFDPPIGQAEVIAPGLRRIVAPNPSPMTWRGTNTYLLGTDEIAVIDPGPADSSHLAAILDACAGQRIGHILVTHAHIDHSPLAADLARETGAPVLAHGDARAGQSAVMRALAARGMAGGGEGVDRDFAPTRSLADGETIATACGPITAHWTPGHFGNHMCFAWGEAVFSGDLVMGWASSLVSPPDGDLTDFMASCRRLAALGAKVLYPGHGKPVDDPKGRITALLAHREAREAAILAALHKGPATAATLAAAIYTDTPPALLPAATRNVFAHLIDLHRKQRVTPQDELSSTTRFALTNKIQES